MAIEQIGKTSGAKSGNEEWFTNDLEANEQIDQGEKWTVHFAISAQSVVEFTLDSGSTWIKLNEGNAHTADAAYEYTFHVDGDDKFNMRATQAVSIRYCRVYIG